ncbi:MAG: outer membrane beta-barrel protein [Betaproteobacteria bacterium]
MKKSLAITLGIVLLLAGSAAAQDVKFTLDAGYMLGSYNFQISGNKMEAKMNGFVLTGEAAIVEPWGAQVNLAFLNGSDFKENDAPVDAEMSLNRMDFLASYSLPANLGDLELRALGGYSITTATNPGSETKISGFLVGGSVAVEPMDNLTINGFFGYGLGMKSRDETHGVETDAGLTTYRVAGAYEVAPNISLEAGYAGNIYSTTATGVTLKQNINGFFLGGRVSF